MLDQEKKKALPEFVQKLTKRKDKKSKVKYDPSVLDDFQD